MIARREARRRARETAPPPQGQSPATIRREARKRAREAERAMIAQRQAAAPPIGIVEESAEPRWRWISSQQFTADCLLLAERLPWPIRGVAGIPRSGTIVAANIACRLNVPLYAATIDRGLILLPSVRAYNLQEPEFTQGPLVVVDDDTWSGRTMQDVIKGITGEVVTAACYSKIGNWQPDIVIRRWWSTWVCEHRFCAAPWFIAEAGWDFDGIFCADCPPEDDDDGPRYLNHLQNSRRLWVPSPHEIPLVATARMEKYRGESEAWLARNGAKAKAWAMGQWPSLRERTWEGVVRLKAEAFARSGLAFFVESCPHQAEAIAREVPRPVFCPPVGRIFNDDKLPRG